MRRDALSRTMVDRPDGRRQSRLLPWQLCNGIDALHLQKLARSLHLRILLPVRGGLHVTQGRAVRALDHQRDRPRAGDRICGRRPPSPLEFALPLLSKLVDQHQRVFDRRPPTSDRPRRLRRRHHFGPQRPLQRHIRHGHGPGCHQSWLLDGAQLRLFCRRGPAANLDGHTHVDVVLCQKASPAEQHDKLLGRHAFRILLRGGEALRSFGGAVRERQRGPHGTLARRLASVLLPRQLSLAFLAEGVQHRDRVLRSHAAPLAALLLGGQQRLPAERQNPEVP
mmetsp:Transcript_172851/g.554157  ORF Transcript_172851/g.554157 Transcript_172851/m.554157 type:complete len:281 (+) Transcript_172851:3019-3861(+)